MPSNLVDLNSARASRDRGLVGVSWRSLYVDALKERGPRGIGRAVLRALVDRVNERRLDWQVWPSLESIAADAGWSESATRRALQTLCEAADPWVEVVDVGGGRGCPAVYRLLVAGVNPARALFHGKRCQGETFSPPESGAKHRSHRPHQDGKGCQSDTVHAEKGCQSDTVHAEKGCQSGAETVSERHPNLIRESIKPKSLTSTQTLLLTGESSGPSCRADSATATPDPFVEQTYSPQFESWWQLFPKRRRYGKRKAYQGWKRKGLDEPSHAARATAVLQKQLAADSRFAGEFAPMPCTYLNQDRHQIEPEVTNADDTARNPAGPDHYRRPGVANNRGGRPRYETAAERDARILAEWRDKHGSRRPS